MDTLRQLLPVANGTHRHSMAAFRTRLCQGDVATAAAGLAPQSSSVRQAAKRQRAQPSESGCDRYALKDPAFAAEASLTSDRGTEGKKTARHCHARSCRVEGPAVVPAVHGSSRTGKASDRYASKDGDSGQVMQLPGTSRSGRGDIGVPPHLLAGALGSQVTNVVGDEQSRASQPDAHSRDE